MTPPPPEAAAPGPARPESRTAQWVRHEIRNGLATHAALLRTFEMRLRKACAGMPAIESVIDKHMDELLETLYSVADLVSEIPD